MAGLNSAHGFFSLSILFCFVVCLFLVLFLRFSLIQSSLLQRGKLRAKDLGENPEILQGL